VTEVTISELCCRAFPRSRQALTGGECEVTTTSPADRGTVEGHDVSGDAAACVGVSSKIADNPPCQNIAVVSAMVAIRQALVVSASHV